MLIRRRLRTWAVLVLAATTFSVVQLAHGLEERALPGTAPPEICGSRTAVPLSLLRPWRGHLEMEQTKRGVEQREGPLCFAVVAAAGALVRAAAELEVPSDGGTVEVYAPGEADPLLRTGLGNVARRALSWQAEADAPHFIALRGFWSLAGAPTVPLRVWVEAVEAPALVQARQQALAADPRLAWLRQYAMPLRSITAEDEDFSDLEPLRALLEDKRIVLLGESTHWSGSDNLARSRLVKFLHRELGFDVLAFESGMYGMGVTWSELRRGAPPREAFIRGAFGFWSDTEQMQPLFAYIGEQARGTRPLEVAGFDNRPWLYWPNWFTSTPRYAEDLARFLVERAIGGPLADAGSREYGVMAALAARRYAASPADAEVRRSFLAALQRAKAALLKLDGDEARLQAEILRGIGCHAREMFLETAAEGELEPQCYRDRVMGEHLVWLANERYPGRKIIAWAHAGHTMRTPRDDAQFPGAGKGPSMGQFVAKAFGRSAYVIAPTSYQGAERHIVRDQHPLLEFEELMEAAGFDYALVDLRGAATEGSWAGGSFLARPLEHSTMEILWSDAVDAFLFIRTQERARRIPD